MNPNEAKNMARRIRLAAKELEDIAQSLDEIHVIEAPDIPGYEYVGYSSSHNPVYRDVHTERLYEQVGGGLAPYAPTFRHSVSSGRVLNRE